MTDRAVLARPDFDPDAPVVGVDIGKKCWVACRIDESLHWVHEYQNLEELMDDAPEQTVIGVDVPVHLEDDWRDCDREAKRLLGARHATIFLTPPRAVFESVGFAAANELAKSLTGKGLSAQSFALKNRIREVWGLVEQRPVFEVHPELSFAVMAGGPLEEPKTTWNGQMRRRQLLADQGLEIPDRLARVTKSAPDDVLDAVAVAWSARRIATGSAERIPADGDGAAMWR